MQRYEMERRFREVFDSCWNPGDVFEAVIIFNNCLRSRASAIIAEAQEAHRKVSEMQKEIYELKKQLGILSNDPL